MSFLYGIPRYLSIFLSLLIFYIALYHPISLVYFLRFKKKKINFVFDISYLSIHYSQVGLDYESIYTILLPFSKIFLYFFPLWYCTLELDYNHHV